MGPQTRFLLCLTLHGNLAITQRREVIKLIPKKQADQCKLRQQNSRKVNRKWNASYSSKLIFNDRTGFVKGKFINIRLVDSIINYTVNKHVSCRDSGFRLRKSLRYTWATLHWKKKNIIYFEFSNFKTVNAD